MKTFGKAMGFGFSAVNAGQRNVSVEPQVIAVSTEGNFRLTPPVTRALGIGHGDYVMFVHNVNEIDSAIAAKDETLVAFCEENGLEYGTPEAAIAIHKEFDMWGIAKGFVEYDAKGIQKVTTERLTKNDKVKFVSQNFDAMLESALAEAPADVQDALTREGVTREEQIDVLTAFVVARELPKYKGSKCANPAGLTGAGTSVNFTDSNVWKQLKVDLGDEATSKNRVYDVDLEAIQTVPIYNGYEMVDTPVLVLGDYTDKEPARIGKDEE